VRITVNGNPTEVPAETTVRQLLDRLGLAGRAVAVELNRELVARKRHEETALRPDDAVELVTLVGGG
jgi:sulfur carrier protein